MGRVSEHPIDKHVGKRLRLRRNALGLSQDELGKSVGVTFQQVQKYERGTNRVGSSRLYEFSKVLKVPINYFFEQLTPNDNVLGFNESQEIMDKTDLLTNKETLQLVQGYYAIEDSKVRQKVLDLIKTLQS